MKAAIPFVIILIVVGLLIIAVSILLYRRHLNKVASGEVHDLHTSTVEPSTVIRVILICVAVIWVLVSLSSLMSEVENLRHATEDMRYNTNDMTFQLNELNNRLDAQNRITADYRYELKNLNSENRTVDMELSVRLKEYREDTVVSVKVGDTVSVLQNEGGVFTGTIPMDLFTPYDYPVLTAETNGLIQTQELDDCPSGVIGEEWLSMLQPATFDWFIEYNKKGEFAVSGTMTIVENDSMADLSLQSASIVFDLDGKIVKEIPLSFVNGVAENVAVSGSFPAQKGQPFYICLKSVTDAGWIITERVGCCYSGEEATMEYALGDGNLSVTEQNGTVLFETGADID